MRRLLFIFIFLLIFLFGYSQGGYVIDESTPITEVLRIKQVSEFMKRFNRDEIPMKINKKDLLWQQKLILSLINFPLYMKDEQSAMNFATEMVKDSVRLNYSDSTWHANAVCDALYNGKKVKIVLQLKTEVFADNCYKWVIYGAYGKFFDIAPVDKVRKRHISPVDNELNFMSLSDITMRESANISDYTVSGYEQDRLSIFLFLVKNKLLKIKGVSELYYVFNESGYSFTVQYFNRENYNTGWLISDFKLKK
jgi:hypothetical protein